MSCWTGGTKNRHFSLWYININEAWIAFARRVVDWTIFVLKTKKVFLSALGRFYLIKKSTNEFFSPIDIVVHRIYIIWLDNKSCFACFLFCVVNKESNCRTGRIKRRYFSLRYIKTYGSVGRGCTRKLFSGSFLFKKKKKKIGTHGTW